MSNEYDIFVDGIFGFGFKGDIREPFRKLIVDLSDQSKKFNIPIVSIDVPSGWDVDSEEQGKDLMIDPAVLLSLTAPKKCASRFKGMHFIGGRFVPEFIVVKYGLSVPDYSGCDQIAMLK